MKSRQKYYHLILTFLLLPLGALHLEATQNIETDICVYGGTSAGVVAAVQAKKMGKSVVIVCPDKHLGGLSSGGLGFSDTGNKAVIGGLSREFYRRIWEYYQEPETWKWQKREDYGNKGQGTTAIDGAQRTMWIFEPHIAERVFEDFIRENKISVYRDEWLDRKNDVKKSGARIISITTLSGKTFAAKMFIDATYEGDLMAAAGVDYHVGREAQTVYGEKWNGVQTGVLHHTHHFGNMNINPYGAPGRPASGILPNISTKAPGQYGSGDKKIQAYCFRLCLTDVAENRAPFPKPDGYDPKQYELLLRIFNAGWRETFHKFDPIPNHKTDCNNHGPMSFDFIGGNYDYPEASYERRREIIKEHETYQKGWLYFVENDPRVPKDVQEKMRRWGLAKDEFTDNGNWPHQLYIREARRMIGEFVMTENELLKRKPTPDSIGMGSYGIDSHNVQRYITPEDFVQNEGDIGVHLPAPYEIAYGSTVPKLGQCENLLVPVCVSSSHIAFGSIRMEPVFMILGQSVAAAAAFAIDEKIPVQKVAYEKLRKQLLADGQVLEYRPVQYAGVAIDPGTLPGIVVDDSEATKTGNWSQSSSAEMKRIGKTFLHDSNSSKGKSSITYTPEISQSGAYEVVVLFPPHGNRANNVPVSVSIGGKETKTLRINQKTKGSVSLGIYTLPRGKKTSVTISNNDTDGYVVADAVQFIPWK
jgi:hypothetical protein